MINFIWSWLQGIFWICLAIGLLKGLVYGYNKVTGNDWMNK